MQDTALVLRSKLVCDPNCYIIRSNCPVKFRSDRLFSLGSHFAKALKAQLSEESQAEIDSTKRLRVTGPNNKKHKEGAGWTATAQRTAHQVQAGEHVVLGGVAFGEAQLRVFGLSGGELLQLLDGQGYSFDTIKALYFLLHLGVTVAPPTVEFFTAATELFTAPTAVSCALTCVWKNPAPSWLIALLDATPPGCLAQAGLDPEDVPSEPLAEQLHVDQATGGMDPNCPPVLPRRLVPITASANARKRQRTTG